MSFDINRDSPWVESVFRKNQRPTIDLKPQLEYLARLSKSDDTYIDESEVRQGKNSHRVDPFTCDLISYFLKHKISTTPWQQKIIVYDNGDGRFNANSHLLSTDVFIAQNAQGEWHDITPLVVSAAQTQNILGWGFPQNADGMSIAALKVLYLLVTDFVRMSDIRELIDSDFPPSTRSLVGSFEKKQNEVIHIGENQIAIQALRSVLKLLKEHPHTVNREKLFLVVVEINHLIDMTDGAAGLELFSEISNEQWQVLLQDQSIIEAITQSLGNAIKVQNWTFFRRFYHEPEKLGDGLLAKLSAKRPQENHQWYDVIMVAALLRSLPKPSSFLITDYLDPLLATKKQRNQLPSSIVNVILESFATLPKRNCAPNLLFQAFDWCCEFYQDFTTFHDKSDLDRLAIARTQEVLMILNAEKAQSIFFQEALSPLSFDFNPRTNLALAHNAYYRHIGAAQNLAFLSGNKKLAHQRKLDQSKNEWGRDMENRMRKDEIFRIDTLNEDPLSPDRYDPDGILKRNLAFIHVLRFIYLQRDFFNPALDTADNASFLNTLNIEKTIAVNFDDAHYKNDAKDFDTWLIQLRKNNPVFFDTIADLVCVVEKDIRLSFEVFFMEANEVETYQYYLDPREGPIALIDFIGAIRSWTSGYQGRLLVRMQTFFIQDKIKADKQKKPNSYKRPEEYDSDFAPFMTEERFEDANFGILPLLKEAENPTLNARLNFGVDEASKILFYFSQNGFAAYITDWLFYIIDHRFVDAAGNEAFGPLEEAFAVLSKTKFPRELMEKEFEKRGYWPSPSDVSSANTKRQSRLAVAANLCLSQLPSVNLRYYRFKDSPQQKTHSAITLTRFFDSDPNAKRTQKMIDDFTHSRAQPGTYQRYRRQARRLLKTHDWEAIDAIVNAALHDVPVSYKTNAPLKPLFPGLIGHFITNDNLDKALHSIAVGNSHDGDDLKAIDFSAIMTRWAEKNHIDLNSAFGEAFQNYEVPPSISSIQDEIIAIKEEIASWQRFRETDLAAEKRLKELHKELDLKTRQRNRMINDLASQPQSYGQQAIIQVITSVYNAVRRQYLREILISGGEITGQLIESFLEDNLLPKKERIFHLSTFLGDEETKKELATLDRKIDFLIDVLSQVEEVEYFNDFNLENNDS